MMWIAMSLGAVVWFTGFEFVQDIFKPNFISTLSYLRMTLTVAGVIMAGFSGPKILEGVSRFAKVKNDALKLTNDKEDEKE